MTPFSSVAMLEKLALFRIAFCSAPVLSSAASRRTSVTTSTVATESSGMTGSWYCADMSLTSLALPKPTAALGDLLCLVHESRQLPPVLSLFARRSVMDLDEGQ